MKREVYKRKVATQEELLAGVLGAASHLKKCENRLISSTLSLLMSCESVLRLMVGFSKICCEL
jgi:hypothetical protein